ncbi:hypothetical protein Hanom_Chr12g01109361 [Helianthus anomalus]
MGLQEDRVFIYRRSEAVGDRLIGGGSNLQAASYSLGGRVAVARGWWRLQVSRENDRCAARC